MLFALHFVAPSSLFLAQDLQHNCHQATRYSRRHARGRRIALEERFTRLTFLPLTVSEPSCMTSPIKRVGMR